MTGASDFEAETKSRGEELTALATAKKVIVEATSGAASQSYSFVQTSMSSGADLAKFEAVRLVRDLAQKQKSPALAQLASKMAVAMRADGKVGDVFAKVKGLLICHLLEASASAQTRLLHLQCLLVVNGGFVCFTRVLNIY